MAAGTLYHYDVGGNRLTTVIPASTAGYFHLDADRPAETARLQEVSGFVYGHESWGIGWVLKLVEEGQFSLDDRVTELLPVSHYINDETTIRHLLNHTSGIPDMPRIDDAEALLTAPERPFDLVYDLRPKSDPGARNAYSALTGSGCVPWIKTANPLNCRPMDCWH